MSLLELTFVNLFFLGLWQGEERFEALVNVVLDFCRHTMANDLEKAILIVAVKDLRGYQ
jgi:hypothetical protein